MWQKIGCGKERSDVSTAFSSSKCSLGSPDVMASWNASILSYVVVGGSVVGIVTPTWPVRHLLKVCFLFPFFFSWFVGTRKV